MTTEEELVPSQISYLQNKRNNSKINQTELETNITKLNERWKQISLVIGTIKKLLPPADLAKSYYVENKINQDTHLFSWILGNKEKVAEDVRVVCMYLEKWYMEKPEDYENNHTLQQYKDEYCRAMAEIRHEMNESSAHVCIPVSYTHLTLPTIYSV